MFNRLKSRLTAVRKRIANAENQLTQLANLLNHKMLTDFGEQFADTGMRITHVASHTPMHQYLWSDFSDRCLQLHGRMAARGLPYGKPIKNFSEVEFRVYSQWGEDGIIEWLVVNMPAIKTNFVEFGVETFREANCRFLMHNRNWKGLVIDGSEDNMASLRGQAYFWMHDLTAKASFVTAENIDALIVDAGFDGPLGILSIDVDGNDYWIWDAIRSVQPAIIICEVNPILGDTRAITIPYDPKFTRFSAHFSGLYFGASICALQHLAQKKGYSFAGTSSSGINAFFVRNDLAPPILNLIEEPRAFPSRVRDSRDQNGALSFAGGVKRLALIADMPVVDVETGQTLRLWEIEKPYSDAWLP